MPSLPKIPDFKFKELLSEIELAGGRDKLKPTGPTTLKVICNSHKHFFGEVGSSERRAIQKKFDNLCARKSIEHYVKTLERFGVTPSASTILIFQKALLPVTKATEEDTDDDEKEEEDTYNEKEEVTTTTTDGDEKETTASTTTKDEEEEEETTTFEHDSSKGDFEIEFDTKPTNKHTMYCSPAKPGVRSPPPQGRSPFPAVPAFDIDDLLPSINDAFVTKKKNGTKMRPHCISVDIHRPENNREFEIHHVQGLESENGGYSHSGFEITFVIPPPDYQEWEAKVVDVPGFYKRAVLIRGLSGGYYLRDSDMTSKYLQVCPHPATLTAVKTHQLDMSDQDDSKYEYWLLFFAPSIELDQRLLAKVNTKDDLLLKHVAGLEKPACPITKKPLVGCRVTFTIAETTGRRRIANVNATDEIQWT
jgi:hypothetical protein